MHIKNDVWLGLVVVGVKNHHREEVNFVWVEIGWLHPGVSQYPILSCSAVS